MIMILLISLGAICCVVSIFLMFKISYHLRKAEYYLIKSLNVDDAVRIATYGYTGVTRDKIEHCIRAVHKQIDENTAELARLKKLME